MSLYGVTWPQSFNSTNTYITNLIPASADESDGWVSLGGPGNTTAFLYFSTIDKLKYLLQKARCLSRVLWEVYFLVWNPWPCTHAINRTEHTLNQSDSIHTCGTEWEHQNRYTYPSPRISRIYHGDVCEYCVCFNTIERKLPKFCGR